MPLTAFFSYSHVDLEWMRLMFKYLTPLQNGGLLHLWSDEELGAGDREAWKPTLLGRLNSAGVILVLLSPDYSASKFCQEEKRLAVARKKNDVSKVYFIHTRPTLIEAEIAQFQLRPSTERALSNEPDRNAACLRIAAEIQKDLAAGEKFRSMGAEERWITFYDRSPQRIAADRLLREKASIRHRPVCLLVAGPDHEEHEMLHERLARNPVAERLIGRGTTPHKLRRFRLPIDPPVSDSDIQYALEDGLRDGFDNLPPGCIYLLAQVNVEKNLTSVHVKAIRLLLSFLDRYQGDLAKGQALCVGVSLLWKGEPRNEPPVGQASLAKKFAESAYQRLSFRVLPDLCPPFKENLGNDSEDWVTEVSQLKSDGVSTSQANTLKEEVARFFEKEETVTFRTLSAKFREVLI